MPVWQRKLPKPQLLQQEELRSSKAGTHSGGSPKGRHAAAKPSAEPAEAAAQPDAGWWQQRCDRDDALDDANDGDDAATK